MSQDTSKKIVRGTFIIIFVSFLAKFASFIAESVLAAYLGTSGQSDAYYIISSVQQVIYPMLSIGVWKIMLPLYKEKLAHNKLDEANALADKSITLFSLMSLVIVAVIMCFSKQVVSLVAPGFTGETKELCAELVRISAPMYIFIIAASVYAVMLQCHDKFFGSQIREVVSHIPTILCAIFLYGKFGVKGLAVALVVGGVARLLVELPFVDWGFKYKPDFRFKDKDILTLIKRLPSVFVSEGAHLLNTLIDKIMASWLAEGAISSLNYGSKLNHVFSGLLSTAVSTAVYPQMVEYVAHDKKEELSRLVSKIICIYAIIMMPISIACGFFSEELITAVYKRGAFNADSVKMTMGIFAAYSASLFFVACNGIFTNIFYSHGDAKKPMIISLIALCTNVGGNILFVWMFGVKGLAIATTVSAVIKFVIDRFFLRKYVRIDNKKTLTTLAKTMLAGVIACAIPWALFRYVIHTNAYVTLIVSAVIGVAAYIPLTKLLRIEETDEVIATVCKKLKLNKLLKKIKKK